jgi:hypothetical protein
MTTDSFIKRWSREDSAAAAALLAHAADPGQGAPSTRGPNLHDFGWLLEGDALQDALPLAESPVENGENHSARKLASPGSGRDQIVSILKTPRVKQESRSPASPVSSPQAAKNGRHGVHASASQIVARGTVTIQPQDDTPVEGGGSLAISAEQMRHTIAGSNAPALQKLDTSAWSWRAPVDLWDHISPPPERRAAPQGAGRIQNSHPHAVHRREMSFRNPAFAVLESSRQAARGSARRKDAASTHGPPRPADGYATAFPLSWDELQGRVVEEARSPPPATWSVQAHLAQHGAQHAHGISLAVCPSAGSPRRTP